MKQILDEPVLFGDTQLAPTVELAGLAEIASLPNNEARAEALVRIAEAIRAEDDARAELASLRSAGGRSRAPLPNRPNRSR
jgi:hypothetical protein